MKYIVSFALMLWACMAGPAYAAAPYEFDKSHTKIVFFISHLGYSNFIGWVTDVTGTLDIDPAKPAEGKLSVTIKTDSIDTGVAELNEKIKKEHFFHVAQFPEATFNSTSIEITGDKTAKVTGDFAMLGVTKPVTFDAALVSSGWNQYAGKEAIGFSATGTIKRSEFGMNYLVPNVGDEVKLVIEAELNREGKKPAK